LPRAAALLILLLAAVLVAAGCGTGGKAVGGDAGHGKQLFTQKCAGCHTLADAAAQGTIGPNLDDAFAPDRKQGFKDSSIRDLVLDQIRFAQGKMPPMLVKGKDAQDVAAYVGSVAGTGNAKPTNGKISATDGKSIFGQAGCGSCHTLKDAASTGTVGPNLDQLKPPEPRVVTQVTNGGAQMPAFKGRLTPAQIEAVAKYVSSVAGK
jgi:cbb3-type cytochrome c oxidase subunit III